MVLTKKANIGLGVGISFLIIAIIIAVLVILLYLGFGGAFGLTVMNLTCSYEKIVKDIDLQPKLIAESGLYECFDNYEGKLIICADGANSKKLLKGKESANGFRFYGNLGSVYCCTIENDILLRPNYELSCTFDEYGEMAESTGVKSTWGADIYYLPNREVYGNRYDEVLYCDYIVNENLFYRYAFFPDTEELSTEQAIEIFNKVFVLI